MDSEVNLSEDVSADHDSAIQSLVAIATYYRIPADAYQLKKDLSLLDKLANYQDLLRASKELGLKARIFEVKTPDRFEKFPVPAIAQLKNGEFVVFGGKQQSGKYRFVHPITRSVAEVELEELLVILEPRILLVTRRIGGPGHNPAYFNFRWFFPSIWRYRRPLGHVFAASFMVQIFGLVTPIFMQVAIDKVLSHKAYATLFVLVGALVVLGLFESIMSYLRSYALTHTTNRIDVELARRLFFHLFHLPMGYFEARAAGQTLARVQEIEKIRGFLTGQALFSVLDVLFLFVYFIVMFAYSFTLAFIVLISIPVYVVIAAVLQPVLEEMIKEKFNRYAGSQQLLVESVIGVQTIKSAAVEPSIQTQWEEKLAAYILQAFDVNNLSTAGQSAIQYVTKLTTAAILLFGAKAVIDGDMTVGELIAFNMISGQVMQPILRLSSLWQEFQQVQISIERLGDILNTPIEPLNLQSGNPPPIKGLIEFREVTFRYKQDGPEILKNVSLKIEPGEVIGIVGRSGSGKSTFAKLIQRFYVPEKGQVLLDGIDVNQLNPSWLRSRIGVVLQENLLFNRSIHDNIALSQPSMTRANVISAARLAGADEFISKLANGYDTIIEERGANLSGGQRQRIAIARAVAVNPPLMIFDEATSALDYESEKIIQKNMQEITRGRTVLIIAHRLQAVRNCNKIIGMEEGRIVEFGTHEELIKKNDGLYSHLWALQSDLGGTGE